MKTPPREKTSLAEYKSTKRKKYRKTDVSRKEWDRIQDKKLPKFRDLDYGDWPVDRIVGERVNPARGSRLEYLVRWEQHPLTQAIWKPEWV